MLVYKRITSLFFILLFIFFDISFAQLKQLSSEYITGIHLFENQLWYIENADEVKVLDLKTDENLTAKYKSYTKSFIPIASNGGQLWLFNNNNIVVLSNPKNKRYSTAKELKDIDHESVLAQKSFIPIGDDQLLIRGVINKAPKNKAPLYVQVNTVLDAGKPSEISAYVPKNIHTDIFDFVYRPGKAAYITDGWKVYKQNGNSFTPIDLSMLDGFKDVRLGKIAKDGSLWVYQDGVGVIQIADKVKNRFKLNPNNNPNDFLSKKRFEFLEVMDNGMVILGTENELWILEKGKFSPFDLENSDSKITKILSWGNSLLVARENGLTIENVY